MEKYLKIIVIAFIVAIAASCSKDDDRSEPIVYPEENPLALYLEESGYNQETGYFIDDGYVEQGFMFKPKVKGKIKAITLKVPDVATNIRVTIWNADSKTIIRTVNIPAVTVGTEIRQEIELLEISPEKSYFISFNGDDAYSRARMDDKDAAYPINAGNIHVLSAGYTAGKLQAFPSLILANRYWGDVSFIFQQTE